MEDATSLDDYEFMVERTDTAVQELAEKDILEYALYLGLNLPEEEDLIWIAEQGLKAPFPEDWKILRHRTTQQVLYYNSLTGEQTLEDPRDTRFKSLLETMRGETRKQSMSVTDGQAHLASEWQLGDAPAEQTEEQGDKSPSEDFAEDSREIRPVSPILDSTMLNSSGSFRRLDARGITISTSSSHNSKDESKGSHSGASASMLTSETGNHNHENQSEQNKFSGALGNRRRRASLSEDDVEILERDEAFRHDLRKASQSSLLQQASKETESNKPNGLSLLPKKPKSEPLPPLETNGDASGAQSGAFNVALSPAPSTAPASSGPSGNATNTSRESRESRHREIIKRIEGEISVLREDIVETRRYADAAAERAEKAHAALVKAEARARLAEEEKARLQNEFEAFKEDALRRRGTLVDELDTRTKQLVEAQDARDAAERKAREVILQEGSRIKQIERELEALRAKMAGIMRNKTGTEGPARTKTQLPSSQKRPTVEEVVRSTGRKAAHEFNDGFSEVPQRRMHSQTYATKNGRDDKIASNARTDARYDDILGISTNGTRLSSGLSTNLTNEIPMARASRRTPSELPPSVASSRRRHPDWV